jgi:hypothetical protein
VVLPDLITQGQPSRRNIFHLLIAVGTKNYDYINFPKERIFLEMYCIRDIIENTIYHFKALISNPELG